MTIETITLQIPLTLYDQLQSLAVQRQQDPVDMLAQLVAIAYEQPSERAIAVLRQAGAIGPDANTITAYLAEHSWHPLPTGGKPASEIIIEA